MSDTNIYDRPGGPVSPPAHQHAGGGNDSGRNLHGRVSAIEAHLRRLATKEDISEVKTLVSEKEASMSRWLIGIILVALISLAVALIRTFLS